MIARTSEARFGLEEALARLMTDLKLDLSAAFDTGALSDLNLEVVLTRLALWIERSEDLSKWIACSAKAEKARAAGLSAFVDRLANEELDSRSVVPESEMAYYEAFLSAMAKDDPETARFDGEGHSRLVQEFVRLDRDRMKVAHLEVAAAHRGRMTAPVRWGC